MNIIRVRRAAKNFVSLTPVKTDGTEYNTADCIHDDAFSDIFGCEAAKQVWDVLDKIKAPHVDMDVHVRTAV